MVPLKPLSFSEREHPAIGRWKAYTYSWPKDTRSNGYEALVQFSIYLLLVSIELIEELLQMSRKVKREATLQEADIDVFWLTAYARIARRSRNDMYQGVSRYPYEIVRGICSFASG
jgi:hypothetical protein